MVIERNVFMRIIRIISEVFLVCDPQLKMMHMISSKFVIFSFPHKTYIASIHCKCLAEVVLMNVHNIVPSFFQT